MGLSTVQPAEVTLSEPADLAGVGDSSGTGESEGGGSEVAVAVSVGVLATGMLVWQAARTSTNKVSSMLNFFKIFSPVLYFKIVPVFLGDNFLILPGCL